MITTTTDDPRVAELLRRREASKTTASKTRKCGACFSPLDEAGVCTGCGSTTYATGKTPKHCPTCDGRINTFSGKCPRCDAKPVVVTPRSSEPEPDRAPPPRPTLLEAECRKCGRVLQLQGGKCYRCRAAEPRPEMCPRGCGKPYHKGFCAGLVTETRADAAEANRPCPTCGKPLHPRTRRCYSCKPSPGRPTKASRLAESSARPWAPDEAVFRYSQDADTAQEDDGEMDGQTLTVEVVDTGAEHYVVLKTHRWALSLDEVDRLAATLRACLTSCTGVRVDGED